MVDGVVTQLDSMGGTVVKCTAMGICMGFNPSNPPCQPKKCQLSVDHGNRCLAYPQDSNTFMIDTDTSKIKQVPTK